MKNYLAFLIFAAFTLSVEADILLQQDLSNETADLFLSKEPVKSEIGFRMTADLSSRLGGDTLRGVAFGLVCEEDLEVRAQEPEHNSNIRNFNSYEFDLGAMSLICGHVENSHILWEDDRAEPIFLSQVVIEVGQGGIWRLWGDGQFVASGTIKGGFDLTKNYYVRVMGADRSMINLIRLEPYTAPGMRADWMRGAWGVNWKPARYPNGLIEGVSIEPFLEQIEPLRTVDYVQVHLNESYSHSPVHSAPHPILEELWQGDINDETGRPRNLVVPRASSGSDPFGDWLKAIKAAGLKTQVHLNAYNLLSRGVKAPAEIAAVTSRWKQYCDSNKDVLDFIRSKPYHTAFYDLELGGYTRDDYPDRKYMFCYAEFILKVFSNRYGDLIDSWIVDSSKSIRYAGDNAFNRVVEDQRLFEAFANAMRSGNPQAAIGFQNGQGSSTEGKNPYPQPTHFDDYMAGHPFGGRHNHADRKNPLYDRNYQFIQWIHDHNGFVHQGGAWQWDDKIIGHYNPKLSTTSWNNGVMLAYSNADFAQWNQVALRGGGAICWGVPLRMPDSNRATWTLFLAKDMAVRQLRMMDERLSREQFPGAPNWARSVTVLDEAKVGEFYYQSLQEGVDFWDPEGDPIEGLSLINEPGPFPDWLTLHEDLTDPGRWILKGKPAENAAQEYHFSLRVADAAGIRDRAVELKVAENPVSLSRKQSPTVDLPDAVKFQDYRYRLVQGRDFDLPLSEGLSVTKTSGPDWLNVHQEVPGRWVLQGMPTASNQSADILELKFLDQETIVDRKFSLQVKPSRFLPLNSRSIESRARWIKYGPHSKSGDYTYNAGGGREGSGRVMLFSSKAFKSEHGFRILVNYTAESLNGPENSFSFGLVSDETPLQTYAGWNPFVADESYGIGVNLTANDETEVRGVYFTNGSEVKILDVSGTNQEFVVGEPTQVVIEIGKAGHWKYLIDGVQEAEGQILEGFDLSKNYHVAIYGHGKQGGKSIQSMDLDFLPPSINED